MSEPTVDLRMGDCLDVMRGMPDKSVDAVITDPPFGIDFKYDGYDDSPENYSKLMLAIIPEFERITRDGFIFVWQSMKNASLWHEWFPIGFRIFAGLKNFTQFRPTPIQYSWDPIVFWGVGEQSKKAMAGMRDYHMGNTAKYVAEKSNGHPCPRPLNTVEYIVNLTTEKGATVIDPFMGSGTTGVACVKLNRNFIGIEINPQYFEIAKRRIEAAQAQLRLF